MYMTRTRETPWVDGTACQKERSETIYVYFVYIRQKPSTPKRQLAYARTCQRKTKSVAPPAGGNVPKAIHVIPGIYIPLSLIHI